MPFIKQKIQQLKWSDILIITIILFSIAIYSSTLQFIKLLNQDISTQQVSFDTEDNYYALINQILLLLLALFYLKLKNFDFKVWQIEISVKYFLIGIVLFIVTAFLMDIFYIIVINLFYNDLENIISLENSDISINEKTFSLILYSIFNGIYEELFFLGICLCVVKNDIKKAFLFSLLIRFSFHTYQGFYTALGITLIIGFIYYVLYAKFNIKNLFPYFISHSMADIFGLSALQFFSQYN